MMSPTWIGCLKVIFFVVTVQSALTLGAQITFADITDSAGIDHQFTVYEGMFGGGAVAFDCNNDGYEDIYMTSGMNRDVLYLNQRDGTFKDIFVGSGLEVTTAYVTQGVASADVNKDGYRDLLITTITTKDTTAVIPRAKNLLFLNNGDNTFRDATKEYGLDYMISFSTGVSFGDVNKDGFSDVYIGNYFLEYDGALTEINDATIVNASRTAQGYLLLNRGGTFYRDVYEDYGLRHRGFGFGGVFTDFDNDGDLDLLINHDFGYKAKPNYLLRNDYPSKSFTYVEKDFGMDLRINAMGAAVGDCNEDGILDYFITNIKFNRFMMREGIDSVYVDRAKEMGTHMFTISWGANFADFDHDGDLDLYVCNGDLNPNCTPMANYMFENIKGSYKDVGRAANVNDYGIGRGSITMDIDNDGDLDLLIINQKAIKDYPVATRSKLFRNDQTGGHWLQVKLKGILSEADGLGCRITIIAGDKRLIREIDGGGSSHLSQNSCIAHFGLGDIEKIDSLIVDWSSGIQQIDTHLNVDMRMTIIEDVSLKKKPNKQELWIIFGLLVSSVLLLMVWKRNIM